MTEQAYSRSNYVKQLCTQYVRERQPLIWETIQKNSFEKYPPKKKKVKHDLKQILGETKE